jgi:hypothetical protein
LGEAPSWVRVPTFPWWALHLCWSAIRAHAGGYTIIRLMQVFSGVEPRDKRDWCEWVNLTLARRDGCKVALFES